jgi:hypothetical protein|tara:strand:+ start:184 stop:408 length:225 start_codon:yes stop_codon:yes gene_type:complete
MPKFLKHRVNGVVYPFNEAMSEHPEMELVDAPDPQFAVANASVEAVVTKTRKKRATKAEMAARESTENTPDEAA